MGRGEERRRKRSEGTENKRMATVRVELDEMILRVNCTLGTASDRSQEMKRLVGGQWVTWVGAPRICRRRGCCVEGRTKVD
jgi:hypothetical protein